MKKIFCVFLALILFLISSGCENKAEQISAVTKGLSFNAEVTYNGSIFLYFVDIDQNLTTQIEALENGEKSGFKTVFSDEGIVFKYNDLEYKTSSASLPDGIITDFIYSVFKNAEEATAIASDSGNASITDKTDKYSFVLTVGATGLPIKIEEKNFGISVIIKNAAIAPPK